MEAGDSQKFADALAEFDSMTRLDAWKTSLLLKVCSSMLRCCFSFPPNAYRHSVCWSVRVLQHDQYNIHCHVATGHTEALTLHATMGSSPC
jgi:Soluble NSF attachment protein, SNAP